MRQHRITIRALAKRMNITMKRVREVRDMGIEGPHLVRDWVEAIEAQPELSAQRATPALRLGIQGVEFSFWGKPGQSARIDSTLQTPRNTRYSKGLIDALESTMLCFYQQGVLLRNDIQKAIELSVSCVIGQLDDLPSREPKHA